MTPQEKAQELVDKYTEIIYPIMNIEKIKQCAVISVDEILDLLWHTHKNESEYRYYLKVKQEIEAL